MTSNRSVASFVIVSLAASAVLPGCKGMSDTEKTTWSTVGGAAAGAVAGRAIAGKKNKLGGTLIGAATGALAGYALSGGFGGNATEAQWQDPGFQQANDEYNAAVEATKAGNEDAALSHYASASRLTPDQPEPYNNAGLIYLGQGDNVNAEANFRKALAVDPTFEPARTNLQAMGLTP